MGKVSYKPIAVSCKGRAKYSRLNTELVPSRDGRGRWIACLVTVLTSWRGLTQRCCWCAGYKEARFARWGKGLGGTVRMLAFTTTSIWLRQVGSCRGRGICVSRSFFSVSGVSAIASGIRRQTSINASQKEDDRGGGEKQTSQGHPLMQPPNTGWKGAIPAKDGGREEQYLQKVSCSRFLLGCSLVRILTLVVFLYC